MEGKEEGIKKLVATIRDGLVTEFQHGFTFKGKQVIPEDGSKDLSRITCGSHGQGD